MRSRSVVRILFVPVTVQRRLDSHRPDRVDCSLIGCRASHGSKANEVAQIILQDATLIDYHDFKMTYHAVDERFAWGWNANGAMDLTPHRGTPQACLEDSTHESRHGTV